MYRANVKVGCAKVKVRATNERNGSGSGPLAAGKSVFKDESDGVLNIRGWSSRTLIFHLFSREMFYERV